MYYLFRYTIFVFSDRRSGNTMLTFNLRHRILRQTKQQVVLKQLKTSDVIERNIFILLHVSNKLQHIQSLKVA
jgi:hypothetical protein